MAPRAPATILLSDDRKHLQLYTNCSTIFQNIKAGKLEVVELNLSCTSLYLIAVQILNWKHSVHSIHAVRTHPLRHTTNFPALTCPVWLAIPIQFYPCDLGNSASNVKFVAFSVVVPISLLYKSNPLTPTFLICVSKCGYRKLHRISRRLPS